MGASELSIVLLFAAFGGLVFYIAAGSRAYRSASPDND
jgi:hypothetical protein